MTGPDPLSASPWPDRTAPDDDPAVPSPDLPAPGPDPSSTAPRPAAAPARLEALVRGRVQGVGFRYFVLREAMGLGLGGFVANQRDGSVRVQAEGPRGDLLELLDRLREGPPSAIVERVIERWEPARGAGSSFRIESGEHRGD